MSMVEVTNTVIQPRAVMVHLENTFVTDRTVMSSWWFWCNALLTNGHCFGDQNVLPENMLVKYQKLYKSELTSGGFPGGMVSAL